MKDTFHHINVDDDKDYDPPAPTETVVEDRTEQLTNPPNTKDTKDAAKDNAPTKRAEVIAKAQQAQAGAILNPTLSRNQKRAAVKKAKNKGRRSPSPLPTYPLSESKPKGEPTPAEEPDAARTGLRFHFAEAMANVVSNNTSNGPNSTNTYESQAIMEALGLTPRARMSSEVNERKDQRNGVMLEVSHTRCTLLRDMD